RQVGAAGEIVHPRLEALCHRGGDRRVAGGAEDDETCPRQGGNEGAPVRNGPALFRHVFRTDDQADADFGFSILDCGLKRCAVRRDSQAKSAEVILPKNKLMVLFFVKVRRKAVAVGEKRAPFAGAYDTEALWTA